MNMNDNSINRPFGESAFTQNRKVNESVDDAVKKENQTPMNRTDMLKNTESRPLAHETGIIPSDGNLENQMSRTDGFE